MSGAPAKSSSTDGLVIAQRYRVERLLGRGGTGSVYEVTDHATGGRIALKCLSAGGVAGNEESFEREYRALSGLRHPGIVEVYDYGKSDGRAYYTMELIEGEHLGGRVPLSVRETCMCLRDVAAILGVLHARGLVHRDISPRNLMRTATGGLKLIDFGTLTPFGASAQVVGTPPFIPPEAMRGGQLDQRVDLFALGALGYWLVTGSHAFPARNLSELDRLHQHPPAPPSSVLALASLEQVDPVPVELDTLLLALLRTQHDERPASTGEVIDRLNALADLEPEAHELNVRGYLDSKAFVGRERESESVREQLERARGGAVSVVSIEAERGLGRTRLLEELAVAARLAGACVVTLGATTAEQPFAAVIRIALELLDKLPTEARESARPYAGTLAHASPLLSTRLGSPRNTAGPDPREATIRLQLAFGDWIAQLARTHLLALFVDDLPSLDEESRAVLAALAHTEAAAQLLIVASSDSALLAHPSAAIASLRAVAVQLTLLPLTEPEILQILRSVFGPAPFLERNAARLFRVSSGHPAYCLELAEHLVRTGLARYVDGVWSLPNEIAEDALPVTRERAQRERLELLSPHCRHVAQALSIPHQLPLTPELAASLAQRPRAEIMPLLSELKLSGVLRDGAEGLVFQHESVRTALYAELSAERRARTHLVIGNVALANSGGDRVQKLRASLHLFRGGAIDTAVRLMNEAGDQQSYETLRLTARLFEEAYALLDAHGLDAHARASALTTLSLASYHVDRRYGRYADAAIRTYEEVLHLPLARRLSPSLGGKLALTVALLTALVGTLRRRERSPSLRQLVVLCMRGCVALTGMASCCLDAKSARRYADTLAPFLALGEHHGAALGCALARLFAQGISDLPARNVAELSAMIARIEQNDPVREVTPAIRREALAGSLFVYGANLCSRDDAEALAVADRLDTFGPLYALNADHLRYNYYLAQGELERAERAQKRVELHAMRLGNAWQVETWAPTEAVKAALRTNDALLARRATEALTRLAPEVPSLALEASHARGVYLLLREQYRKAIELLDTNEEPLLVAGWARTRGALARCHNALGEHARAQEICHDALSRITEADLAFAVSNLGVQIELAHAEAGLGRGAAAARRLDALLARHAAADSALTLGALHEARCRVALRMSDLAAAQTALHAMDQEFRRINLPTLRDVVDGLTRQLEQARGGSASAVPSNDAGDLPVRVQQLLTHSSATTVSKNLSRALTLTVESAGACTAFLVPHAESLVPAESVFSENALRWAEQRLATYVEDERTVRGIEPGMPDSQAFTDSGISFCFIPLWAAGVSQAPIAGLVLGSRGAAPVLPDASVLRMLAQLVIRTQRVG